MQAAELRDVFRAGAQREMIGIANNQLRVERVQILRGETFDARLGRHRHKARRFNVAVRGVNDADARAGA